MEGVHGEEQGRSCTEMLKARKNALAPTAIAGKQHYEDRGVPVCRTGFSLLANAPPWNGDQGHLCANRATLRYVGRAKSSSGRPIVIV